MACRTRSSSARVSSTSPSGVPHHAVSCAACTAKSASHVSIDRRAQDDRDITVRLHGGSIAHRPSGGSGDFDTYKGEWFELQRSPTPAPAGAGGHPDGDRVVDLAVGHDARPASTAWACCRSRRTPPRASQALPTQWGFAEQAADQARPGRRPQELARDDGVPPRRVEGAGPQRGRRRAAALAQRVQRVHARSPERHASSTTSGNCSTRPPTPALPAPVPPSSARPTSWSRRSAICRRSPAASAWCSGSPTTGPTVRPRCARGTCWLATSSPRSTARPSRLRESQEYLHANQAELMAGASKAVVSQDHRARGRRGGAGRPRWPRPRRPPPTRTRQAVRVPARRRRARRRRLTPTVIASRTSRQP